MPGTHPLLFQCRIHRLIRGILDCFTAHGARVKGGTRLIVVVVVIVIVTEQEQWSSIDGACPVVAVGVCSAHGRVGSLGVWGKMCLRRGGIERWRESYEVVYVYIASGRGRANFISGYFGFSTVAVLCG